MSTTSRVGNPFAHPEDSIVIRTYRATLPDGFVIPSHSHAWAQLIHAQSGVMTVRTPAGVWVTPAHRAVWAPAGFAHSITMTGSVTAASLYFRPGFFGVLPQSCTVVHVPALLRELIAYVIGLRILNASLPAHERLARVIADQIAAADAAPLELSNPRDARAARAAEWARRNPEGGIAEAARVCGASSRTLDRLFVSETGLNFGRWRRRARMMFALELLASGEAVTNVALEAGYQGASAFVVAFRREFGVTPGAYFRDTRPGVP